MAAPALPVGELVALTRENALPDNQKIVRTTLEWIGFQHAIQRERITEESLVIFGNVQMLKESEIFSLVSSFGKRTTDPFLTTQN